MILQDEEKKQSILKLLKRIDIVYRSKPRPDDELLKVAKEWYNLIGFCNPKQLDDALTIYIREDSGSNRYAPKPGELLRIYNEISKEQHDYKNWDTSDLCELCHGNGWAIIDLPEDEDYGCFAIKCPCQKAGEVAALNNGSKLTRKLGKKNKKGEKYYWGKLTFWLENERFIKGIFETPKKKTAQEVEAEQQTFDESEPWIEERSEHIESFEQLLDDFGALPPDWEPF